MNKITGRRRSVRKEEDACIKNPQNNKLEPKTPQKQAPSTPKNKNETPQFKEKKKKKKKKTCSRGGRGRNIPR